MGVLIRFPIWEMQGNKMAEWQGFYSTTQVSRLTGVPRRTLYDWRTRGIIAPSVKLTGPHGVEDEGYSYTDLAIIKLLRGLKDKQLGLKSVVRTLRHLFERFGPPNSPSWEGAHVFILNKEVFAQKPDDWDSTVATRYGQKAEIRVLGELVEEDAAILVPRAFAKYVEINPEVMEGMPVIRDTRIPTATIAMMIEQRISITELEELYSPIPREYLRKANDFERSLDRSAA